MHALLGVFRSFSLLSVHLLSLLSLNFRAGYTFKSQMCRGIVGDEQSYLFCTYKTFRWIKLENAPVEIEVIWLLLAFLQLKWKSQVIYFSEAFHFWQLANNKQ